MSPRSSLSRCWCLSRTSSRMARSSRPMLACRCFLLATVYAFYRYVKKPTPAGLVLTGLAAGLGLATKHSAILIPRFCSCWPLRGGSDRRCRFVEVREGRSKQALRLLGALVVIGVIAVAVLWSFYGFHFHPKAGVDASTRVVGVCRTAEESRAGEDDPDRRALASAAAVLSVRTGRRGIHRRVQSYVLAGHGLSAWGWPYFPVAFAIKTTLGLLILLALVPLSLARSRDPSAGESCCSSSFPRRSTSCVAMGSGMNIGVRHILPVYPFLMILAAWGAWRLIQRQRRWAYVVALLLCGMQFRRCARSRSTSRIRTSCGAGLRRPTSI